MNLDTIVAHIEMTATYTNCDFGSEIKVTAKVITGPFRPITLLFKDLDEICHGCFPYQDGVSHAETVISCQRSWLLLTKGQGYGSPSFVSTSYSVGASSMTMSMDAHMLDRTKGAGAIMVLSAHASRVVCQLTSSHLTVTRRNIAFWE